MKYIILSITESDFEVLGHEVEFGENKKYPPIEIKLDDGKKVQITRKNRQNRCCKRRRRKIFKNNRLQIFKKLYRIK